MAFFQQQQHQYHYTSAHPVEYASRKRKEMDEETAGNGACNIAERRKIALPSRKNDGHQAATFHPLGTEDNLRMLASLGLLENHASSSRIALSSGTPNSASSDSSCPDHYFSSRHGHYPNVEPYYRQGMSSGGDMDLDTSSPATTHGPQCTSLPQLYICHEMDSALYARCVDCSHTWHVGPGQSLSYSP